MSNRTTALVATMAQFTIPQLRDLAKRRDLESRHTMRLAARLQGEADAARKEIRRRQRAERQHGQ